MQLTVCARRFADRWVCVDHVRLRLAAPTRFLLLIFKRRPYLHNGLKNEGSWSVRPRLSASKHLTAHKLNPPLSRPYRLSKASGNGVKFGLSQRFWVDGLLWPWHWTASFMWKQNTQVLNINRGIATNAPVFLPMQDAECCLWCMIYVFTSCHVCVLASFARNNDVAQVKKAIDVTSHKVFSL